MRGSDQLRIGFRAEAVVARRRFRRCELNDPKSVVTIRNVGEQADVGHPDLHIVRVVDLTVGIEDLIDSRMIGSLDVEYDKSLLARRNVGIGAHQVDIVGFGKWYDRALDSARVIGIGHVDDLYAFGVTDERITELNLDRARVLQRGRSDLANDAGLEWVIDVDDDKPAIAGYVCVSPGNRDVVRTVQHSVRIPGQRALEKVISRIAVQKRRHVHQYQALVLVGHIEEGVQRMNWLLIVAVDGLLILRPMDSVLFRIDAFGQRRSRIDSECRRRSDRGSILSLDVQTLTHR